MPRLNHLYIVCHSYYDQTGTIRRIGGVETYVECLAALLQRHGWGVTILQYGQVSLSRALEPGRTLILWRKKAELQRLLRQQVAQTPGLVVYSDYGVLPSRLEHPCIILQHGVGWDYWATSISNLFLTWLNNGRKAYKRWRLHRRLVWMTLEADRVLCVDTNYRNWLMATYPRIDWGEKLVYVPNFASVATPEEASRRWASLGGSLRCVFPRRFAIIRGAVLFARIVAEVAAKLPAVQFAFIGDGECEPEIRKLLGVHPRVEIYRCEYEQMPAEYLRAHLAIIPTLASEGTSLSCVEAMAAGCAVLATTVGGLGNLILPDYNGVLCEPTERQVRDALLGLLQNEETLRRLGKNARETVIGAFSKERWEHRVLGVIENVLGEPL